MRRGATSRWSELRKTGRSEAKEEVVRNLEERWRKKESK